MNSLDNIQTVNLPMMWTDGKLVRVPTPPRERRKPIITKDLRAKFSNLQPSTVSNRHKEDSN